MKLSSGQVRLFYVPAAGISDPMRLARYRSVLSWEEIQKADRFRTKQARNLSLTARALLRYLLSELTGLAPDYFSFVTNEHGKPGLDPDPGGLLEKIPYFNLSHTRGGVVCGLGLNHEIGVDIEALDRRVNPAVADRFFSPGEAAWVAAERGTRTEKERFLEIWTLKEAYIKAKGRGLAIPLRSFSFDLGGPGIGIDFEDQEDNPGNWQFFRWAPGPGKIAAAAVESAGPIAFKTFNCIPFEGIYD